MKLYYITNCIYYYLTGGHLCGPDLKECMPLSNILKSPVPGEQQRERKRRCSDNSNKFNNHQLSPNFVVSKKVKHDISATKMTESQKKANFSSLTNPNNGFNRHTSPLVNSKPGSAKKLIIKNFKGKLFTTALEPSSSSTSGFTQYIVC